MSKDTTHIRIDRDLKSLLEQQAGRGESVNDVIRRLLTGEPVNQPVNTPVNTWQDELQTLTNRVIVLETETKMDSDYIDHLETRVQALEALVSSSRQAPKDHAVISTLADTPSDEPAHKAPDEYRVHVTEEMRSDLAARVTRVKADQPYHELAEVLGVHIAVLKKLCNPNNPPKTISRDEYNILKNL